MGARDSADKLFEGAKVRACPRTLRAAVIALVIGGGCGLLCRDVSAQNRSQFFQKDFAKSPLEEKRPLAAPALAPTVEPAATTPPAEAGPADPMTALKEKMEQMQSGSPTKTPDLTALEKTHKVTAIGAIVNALDKAHLQEKMKELAEVVERFDFDVGMVWAIGTIPNITTTEEMLYLVARNGVVEAAEMAPERYKVTTSPTWIVRTPEGEILLEGTGPLAQHFNLRGEFVEKPGSTESIDHGGDKSAGEGSDEGGEPPPVTPAPSPSPTPNTLFGADQPKL